MLLSKRKKTIFLHIPKTAGTSIAHALKTPLETNIMGGKRTAWDYHTSVLTFQDRVENFDSYFIFTFVRDPWDRLYSWYTMLANNRGSTVNDENFKQWLLSGNHDMSSAFKTKSETSAKISAQKTPQIQYMLDSKGNNRVSWIGKFESINSDFKDLCKVIGINTIKLAHARKGVHKPYREAYDEECIEFVRKYHAEDIDAFGYTF